MSQSQGMKQHPYDVIAVSSNAALDSYYVVPGLLAGAVNRTEKVFHTAGGKGINFSRAFNALGGRVLNLGIVGGHTGSYIVDELTREDIPCDMVWVDQETRRSSTIISLDDMQTTVMLDSGNQVAVEDGDRLSQKVLEHIGEASFLVLTGSLSTGLPTHFYADIVRSVKPISDIAICLDCNGDVLQSAAANGVKVIKVNASEYQTSFSNPGGFTLSRITSDFELLHKQGLELLIITDGPNGAYVYSTQSPPFQVKTQVIRWVSTAGAGDSFLAGLLYSLNQGKKLEEAAAYASAAATAALQQIICGYLTLEDVDRFLDLTSLHPLNF